MSTEWWLFRWQQWYAILSGSMKGAYYLQHSTVDLTLIMGLMEWFLGQGCYLIFSSSPYYTLSISLASLALKEALVNVSFIYFLINKRVILKVSACEAVGVAQQLNTCIECTDPSITEIKTQHSFIWISYLTLENRKHKVSTFFI